MQFPEALQATIVAPSRDVRSLCFNQGRQIASTHRSCSRPSLERAAPTQITAAHVEVTMSRLLKRFVREESAPTIVEYAIMIALIAIVVAASTPGISQAVISVFTRAAAVING